MVGSGSTIMFPVSQSLRPFNGRTAASLPPSVRVRSWTQLLRGQSARNLWVRLQCRLHELIDTRSPRLAEKKAKARLGCSQSDRDRPIEISANRVNAEQLTYNETFQEKKSDRSQLPLVFY
jgi:hypothetical protein